MKVHNKRKLYNNVVGHHSYTISYPLRLEGLLHIVRTGASLKYSLPYSTADFLRIAIENRNGSIWIQNGFLASVRFENSYLLTHAL